MGGGAAGTAAAARQDETQITPGRERVSRPVATGRPMRRRASSLRSLTSAMPCCDQWERFEVVSVGPYREPRGSHRRTLGSAVPHLWRQLGRVDTDRTRLKAGDRRLTCRSGLDGAGIRRKTHVSSVFGIRRPGRRQCCLGVQGTPASWTVRHWPWACLCEQKDQSATATTSPNEYGTIVRYR